MRKSIAFLCVLVMLMSSFSIPVLAATMTISNFSEKTTGEISYDYNVTGLVSGSVVEIVVKRGGVDVETFTFVADSTLITGKAVFTEPVTTGTYSFQLLVDSEYVQTINRTVSVGTVISSVNVALTGSGKVNGTGDFSSGTIVTLVAVANEGYKFSSWTLLSPTTISGLDKTNPTTSFLMPEEQVNLVATFVEYVAPTPTPTPAQKYTVSVLTGTGGTVSGATTYEAGKTVTLVASPSNTHTFSKWVVSNPSALTLTSLTNASTQFTMPEEDVTITATFVEKPKTYRLAIKAGTGGIVYGEGSYQEGERIWIEAIPDRGYSFIEWNAHYYYNNVSNMYRANTYFEMPARDTTIDAIFERSDDGTDGDWRLRINVDGDGTVEGTAGWYFRGDKITLKATADDGGKFIRWKDSSGNSLSTNANYTYTMPAKDVTVTAVFEDIPEPTATSTPTPTGATGGNNTTNTNVNSTTNSGLEHLVLVTAINGQVPLVGRKKLGDFVEVTATGNSGYTFEKWSVLAGNAILSTTTNPTTSFTMPDTAVTLQAVFSIPATPTPTPAYVPPVDSGSYTPPAGTYVPPVTSTATTTPTPSPTAMTAVPAGSNNNTIKPVEKGVIDLDKTDDKSATTLFGIIVCAIIAVIGFEISRRKRRIKV